MNLKEFENLLVIELEKIINNIVKDNEIINISAKTRAGAEISDWLEDKFVEYTNNHQYFYNSESAPKGKTKNPWDAKTYFRLSSIHEELWIDFKAIKISQLDSNPDIGTPNKIFNLIKNGSFYLVYIYVYYESINSQVKFVKYENKYTKIYLLKDISKTVRRNPKNQLQVNISVSSEYRSREEFIDLLIQKLKESHQRQIEISQKQLVSLDKLKEELLEANNLSQSQLENNLKEID